MHRLVKQQRETLRMFPLENYVYLPYCLFPSTKVNQTKSYFKKNPIYALCLITKQEVNDLLGLLLEQSTGLESEEQGRTEITRKTPSSWYILLP